jgi:hypothetical protein
VLPVFLNTAFADVPDASAETEEKKNTAATSEKQNQAETAKLETAEIQEDAGVFSGADQPGDESSRGGLGEGSISTSETDPVLVEIRDRLRLLARGALTGLEDIERLFTIPLERLKPIKKQAAHLTEEKARLALAIAQIQERLKAPEKEISVLERPPVLDTLTVAPEPPLEPIAPEAPAFKEPKGKKHAKRSAKWIERYDAWEQYRALLADFEAQRAQFEKKRAQYESELARFTEEKAAYDSALKSYERAEKERDQAIAELKQQLQKEAADTKIRLEVAGLRLGYLETLSSWFAEMPAPALEAFAGLKIPRSAIRARAASLQELDRATARLSERLGVLHNRTISGALIGFQVERDKLATDIDTLKNSLGDRKSALEKAARDLNKLADALEKESGAVRETVLANVMSPNRKAIIDGAFASRLKDMRHGSTAISLMSIPQTAELGEKDLVDTLDGLLQNPETASSTADGGQQVDRIKAHIEMLDSAVDSGRVDSERFRQAFRREAVTVLSSLASPEARKNAYSLSSELLADLVADIENLKRSLARFGDNKKAEILDASRLLESNTGILWLVRLVFAVVVLLVIAVLGRRIGGFIAAGIRRLSMSSFFRHRVGSLVRWAGLVEILLPTLLFAAASYAVLALIGFERPETRFVEVALRWLIVYALGRRLLEGLTKRVSRGRPALISAPPEVSALLGVTYGRLGIGLAVAAIFHEWTNEWLGAGILGRIVMWVAWLWLGIWGLWALFIWRRPLGESLRSGFGDATPAQRMGAWMIERRIGGFLSPIAALLILVRALTRWISTLLAEGGFFAYLRARSLRRRSRLVKPSDASRLDSLLPEPYTKEFPLYPIYDKEDAVLLPREGIVQTALDQVERWRAAKQDSSLVVIGEKGIGKTTFLSLVERRIESLPVTRYSLSRKLRKEEALAAELGPVFGIDNATNVGMIASQLKSGDERIVLLDEAHNVFLRTVDGYDAYEALVRLVNHTSDKVFWVLVFNAFSWAFINESRKRIHYFRRLLRLPSWGQDEIQDLIVKRNKKSGFEIVFDEMLLDENRSLSGQFEVVEGADGFFRLLWETSRGNPRVATHLWLKSLTPLGENKLNVGLFGESSSEELVKMDRELLFTLAAVCQHENLSVAELKEVLNVSLDFAGFAVRYLTEYNLLEPKHTDQRRMTLAPHYYPQILKILRQNHLIFESE